MLFFIAFKNRNRRGELVDIHMLSWRHEKRYNRWRPFVVHVAFANLYLFIFPYLYAGTYSLNCVQNNLGEIWREAIYFCHFKLPEHLSRWWGHDGRGHSLHAILLGNDYEFAATLWIGRNRKTYIVLIFWQVEKSLNSFIICWVICVYKALFNCRTFHLPNLI